MQLSNLCFSAKLECIFTKLKCYLIFEYVLHDWNKDGYIHFRVWQMFIEPSQYYYSNTTNQFLLMKANIYENCIYMYFHTKNYSDWLRKFEEVQLQSYIQKLQILCKQQRIWGSKWIQNVLLSSIDT